MKNTSRIVFRLAESVNLLIINTAENKPQLNPRQKVIFKSNKLKLISNTKKLYKLSLLTAAGIFFSGCFGESDEHSHHDEEFSFEGDFLATDENFASPPSATNSYQNSKSEDNLEDEFALDDLFLDSGFEEVPVQEVQTTKPLQNAPQSQMVAPPQYNQAPSSGQQKINNAIQQRLEEQDKKIETLVQNSTKLEMLLEEEREKNRYLQEVSKQVATNPSAVNTDRYNALLKEKMELEQRLRALEQKLMGGPPSQAAPVVAAPIPEPAPAIPMPKHEIPEPVNVELQAEVTYVNGKTSAAFFTAFYITTQSLDEIIKSLNEDWLQQYGIQSSAELWARAIKNPYEFPDVANQIRRALSTSRVARVSTNMQGSAEFKDVLTGEYYIIGAAPLGQIGVVWSLPIDITKTTDSIYLSGDNASWSL